MTDKQKDIAWLLLQPDHYMKNTTNVKGKVIYKIYSGNNSPVQYFSECQVKKYSHLFKIDDAGRITLNLNKLRQLSGNDYIKILYKKYRHNGKN